MGLSVTNTLVILIRGHGGGVPPLLAIRAEPVVLATVLFVTIVRFYLGNDRHVDDTYGPSRGGTFTGRTNHTALRFVIDFSILLLEALMFGVASFYVGRVYDFLVIMMAILLVDIAWNGGTQGTTPHQRVWLLNNLGHLAAIFVCFAWHQATRESIAGYLAIGLLLSNGLVDFWWSRTFYFARPSQGKSVFLSAPFSSVLDEHKGNFPPEVRERIETIIDRLEAREWIVFNSHRRERWGADLDTPYAALRNDLEAIASAERLVAVVGTPPSPGVQLEIGFALACGKPVVIVNDNANSHDLPYLIRGVIEHESSSLLHAERYSDPHELAEIIQRRLESD